MSAPATSTTPATPAAAAPATATPVEGGAAPAATPAATPAAAPAAAASGTFQSASLYVGDLHNDITEGLLFELFNRVGPVASIRVCRDTITRRSLGYAYVNFHDVQDAERALDTMQFTEIKNKACRIMWSQRDPSLRKSGVGNVFVKNLDIGMDNKQLFDIFSMFGNILSCKVAVNDAGESKGYGYIHFETADAATEAVAKLNGASLDGTDVSVSHFVRAQDRAGQPEWTNLYVKQFPVSYCDDEVKALFSPFGEVVSVFIDTDDEGKSKGFGFVNFVDHESAEKALEALNGKSLDDADSEGGKTELYVSKGQKKAERTREIKAKVDALNQEKLAKFNGMNLFVKNLDDSITEEILRESFDKFGTITSAKIVVDDALPGSPSKGFGYVCFSSPEEATRAVTELNGKILRSKPITVALHQTKQQRAAHLAATYQPRNMRFPGGNMGGGQPMPYMQNMYAPAGQQFPGGRGPGAPQGQYGFQHGFNPQGPRGQMGRQGGPQGGYMGQPGAPAPYGGGYQGGMQVGGPQQVRRNMPPQGGNNMPRRVGPGPSGRGAAMNQNRPLDPRQGMMPAPGSRGAQQSNQQRFQGQPQQRVPQQPMIMPMQGQAPQQQMMPMQAAARDANAPIDDQALAAADPHQQKNMIGERLYPLIYQHQDKLAGKITGMLLEMDNAELLNLIESPDALLSKIEEALEVLKSHQDQGTTAGSE